MNFEITNNELIVLIDKNIYNEEVLYKCFYWYGSNYIVEIRASLPEEFMVRLKSKTDKADFGLLIEKIQQDLVDFKLRDIVTKETKTIRELIVAKAFAYYGLEDNPKTEISDPVGFNPMNVI